MLGEDNEIWFAKVVKAPRAKNNLAKLTVSWYQCEARTSSNALLISPEQNQSSIELGAILDKVAFTKMPGKQLCIDNSEYQRVQVIGT